MDCPKCEKPIPDEAVECPACGIVLAKYRAQVSPEDLQQWRVRGRDSEYSTSDRKEVLAWLREGRIERDYTIFDPTNRKWISVEQLTGSAIQRIPLTTTISIEGHRILRYISIESAEKVFSTAYILDLEASLLSVRSGGTESNLAQARTQLLQQLRHIAFYLGGNAVVGVDVDYVSFATNRTGVIVTGTVVEAEAIEL